LDKSTLLWIFKKKFFQKRVDSIENLFTFALPELKSTFLHSKQNESCIMNKNALMSSAATLVIGFLVNKFMPGASTWAVPAISALASILLKQDPKGGALSGLLGGGVLGGLSGAMAGADGTGLGSLLGGMLGDNGGLLSSLLGGGILGGAGGGIGGFLQGMLNKQQQN
jgi:hypothetical protein